MVDFRLVYLSSLVINSGVMSCVWKYSNLEVLYRIRIYFVLIYNGMEFRINVLWCNGINWGEIVVNHIYCERQFRFRL